VDRRPEERRLNDGAVLEGNGQLVPREPREARPQPDIARWRVLGLESADLLDRVDDREARALEEELPGEECPVQVALAEDALGHGHILPGGARAGTLPRLRTMPS
jgi:hypothetical protein